MALQTVPGSDGLYAVDWEILMRICRSAVRARSTVSNAKRNVESPWIGADVVTLDVNWEQVRVEVERDSKAVYQNMVNEARTSMSRAAAFMQRMVAETKYYNDEFRRRQREASDQTMKNVDKSVNRLETTVDVLKGIRDFSAEFLVVSAGAFTGGAGLALGAGGGALLKGSAKWEDTGNFGAGVLTASTELLFTVIPVKFRADGMSRAGRQVAGLIIAHIKPGVEIVKSVYEGKTVLNGVIAGGLKFQDPAVAEIFKQYINDQAPEKMKLIAVPVVAGIKFFRNMGIAKVQQMAAPQRMPAIHPAAAVGQKFVVPAAIPHITPSVVDLAVFEQSCVAEFGICKVPA